MQSPIQTLSGNTVSIQQRIKSDQLARYTQGIKQTKYNMKTYSVNGTYGSSNTPCIVFVYEQSNGTTWYSVEGSLNVNLTALDEIIEGVDVEDIQDINCFTWSSPINSLEELEIAVEN